MGEDPVHCRKWSQSVIVGEDVRPVGRTEVWPVGVMTPQYAVTCVARNGYVNRRVVRRERSEFVVALLEVA